MNDLQKAFIEMRDIPYSIPLSYGAEDRCCSGKHKKLSEVFKNDGYEVRWRVCTFKWSEIHLPENVAAVPHDDNSTHAYLEVKIGGEWKRVDATWDKPLASVLPVNDWDGGSDTAIAVPVISTYSPEESASIMDNESRETTEADLRVNGKFYEAFNQWLAEVRQKSENNMKPQFTIGAFGVIFDEHNRILLVHRTDYDLWNLPGGIVENGEAPWQGVLREIKEETGFEAEVVKIAGVSFKPDKNNIVFTFLCKVIGGQSVLSRESDKIEYFEIDKVPHNTVIKQVERIKDVMQNPDEVILKIQTGKTSIELIKEGKL